MKFRKLICMTLACLVIITAFGGVTVSHAQTDGGDKINVFEFSNYCNGICDHKDTAFLETVDLDGYGCLEVVPNLTSSAASEAINLDGWNYAKANINVEKYGTLLVLYKYVSENPISGKARLSVMAGSAFTGGMGTLAREELVANRWAIASFDLTPLRSKIKEGKEPIISQMHYYPLGSAKVSGLSPKDRIYIANMYAVPAVTERAEIHEDFMNGYSDGTFGISGNMTRAEACTIVARLTAGSDEAVPADRKTTFTDVPESEWYHKYVSYIESLGFLNGYDADFLPNQAITRAEFVELVFKMNLLKDADGNGVFTDVSENHPRATVVSAAGKAGLINGYSNGDGTFSFKPDATITRAEVVKVINNAYGKIPSVDGIFSNASFRFSDVKPEHWAYADILEATTGHMAYFENGKEVWFAYSDPNMLVEDFTPDYEAGKDKAMEIESLFERRVEEIRSTPSREIEVTGKTYYVSTDGNDSNDGLSPESPLKTVSRANAISASGDRILFKRGDIWRERWTARSGVSYSAYGEGEKPVFNGNLHGNVADESLWTLVEGTENIWKYANKILDVGNIVLNDGEATVEKVVPSLSGDKVVIGRNGAEFDIKKDIPKDLHFVNIYDNIVDGKIDPATASSDLYMRCDAGNPGAVYDSAELCYYGHIIYSSVRENVNFDNIKLIYTGGHGIAMGNVTNVSCTNMEVAYIGGTAQYFGSTGIMTRFGNGIEVYGWCNGFYIDNCYIYQCYDAGITHQYANGGNGDIVNENVKFTNNVIDRCIYNIEYFMGEGDSGNEKRLIRNVEYSGNLLMRSGFGWGMNPGRSASVKGWDYYNKSEGFVIKDNIFCLNRINACDLNAKSAEWLPLLSGNTYVCSYGGQLTRVKNQLSANGKALEELASNHGETDAKIYYLPADYEMK